VLETPKAANGGTAELGDDAGMLTLKVNGVNDRDETTDPTVACHPAGMAAD
jgi:hypothetical protein